MIVKKIYPVTDMMCTSCANSVQTALEKEQGVVSANVNYANAKATVEFDTKITSPEKLKKTIIDAGYDLEIDYLSVEELEQKQAQQHQKLRKNFWGSLVCAVPVFIISMFHLHFPYHQYVQGILATITLFFFGRRFFVGAYKQLLHKSANMDTLVAVSTGTAFLYSWSNVFFADFWISKGIEPHLYFEAAVVIIAFILLGKLLEEQAKGKTSEAIKKLMGLQPTSVWVKKDADWVEIPINDVQKGDVILVKPGQKIAVDGKVIQGESYVDESMITGEPLAIRKLTGKEVFAGTINQLGSFQMEAEKIGAQTLLSSIVKAVEEAQGSKAPVQKLVDKIAGIFVPAVICIAIISFVLWIILDKQNGFSYGLQAFVTVLVIACPCALGLATPTAIMVGIGKGAENGILIKDAESLELASKVSTIVLDKTGTITEGNPVVTHSFWTNQQKHLPILYSLEHKSEHPIAQAIIRQWKNIPLVEISDFENKTGQGVQAYTNNLLYRVGSVLWFKELDFIFPENIQQKIDQWKEKSTVILFAEDKNIVAVLAISDTIKKTSKQAIELLQKQSIDVYMLTGDEEKSAQNIAEQVGISHVKSGVKPAEKQSFVKELQQANKIVAMVGDGINDSQALAQSDVSIAMGKGSDIAMSVAQITLISSDLLKIPQAIKLSYQTVRTIRQNLFWAFIYNVIGIPIAAGVLYPLGGFLLNPMLAGAAMALSSVSVVTNSLLLKRKKI
ncbi:heavy metal translocating P-type ATPase [Capnocytophaga catalasegens]|uniref:Copper-translocating P-type ATPase n=1 Tax=Capnocytophaga catalasegens TaxID=1004260 RepID=A0AAV5AWN8_9FLAO|nr:heavy metal translocating P-type ATPase [Capnocytophaga catalasegens]GIZ15033.1 copper-translocating P-type ATPase [Capnocytophaga catalasegens]GJM49413.1 copper-translocating P-type ATPase [Capnocytophaga catalasegens]GJM52563.1 copper-translocating P-type ATPase [Capnocytophaga catalasegens]